MLNNPIVMTALGVAAAMYLNTYLRLDSMF